jgi:hypothetical protein
MKGTDNMKRFMDRAFLAFTALEACSRFER